MAQALVHSLQVRRGVLQQTAGDILDAYVQQSQADLGDALVEMEKLVGFLAGTG